MENVEIQMKKSIDSFKKNLATIRTTRANPDILNNINGYLCKNKEESQ